MLPREVDQFPPVLTYCWRKDGHGWGLLWALQSRSTRVGELSWPTCSSSWTSVSSRPEGTHLQEHCCQSICAQVNFEQLQTGDETTSK